MSATHETKARFVELRAAGLSFAKIAARLHISKDTCHRWESELAESIRTLQDEERDNLLAAYRLTQNARLRQLAKIVKKMDAAIAKLDFSKVPPGKLLEMRLRYGEAIRAELGDGETVDNTLNVTLRNAGETDDVIIYLPEKDKTE